MSLTYDVLLTKEQIQDRVNMLGQQISNDYKGKSLVIVGVLKGAFIFAADLIRSLDLPVNIEFIGVSSYQGTKSTGHVRITTDLSADIKNKNVLLVEDIIDTGRTIDYLLDLLKVRNPASLKVCTFLSKPECHDMEHKIDYVAFEIKNEFVIGYGLDLDGDYRQLPFLAKVQS